MTSRGAGVSRGFGVVIASTEARAEKATFKRGQGNGQVREETWPPSLHHHLYSSKLTKFEERKRGKHTKTNQVGKEQRDGQAGEETDVEESQAAPGCPLAARTAFCASSRARRGKQVGFFALHTSGRDEAEG
jgi:hypothetical protein